MASSTGDRHVLRWEDFFDELGHFLQSLERAYLSPSENYAAYVMERLEVCIISLNAIKLNLQEPQFDEGSPSTYSLVILQYRNDVDELLRICRALSRKWERKLEEIENARSSLHIGITPELVRSSRGRPRFDISREQLLYLSSMSFSWTDIAKMLGVSRMTIYRRRVEFSLVEDPRIVPTDAQLRTAVRSIQAGQPALGEAMIIGRIRAMGYKVTRERLRQEIRFSDPLQSALRWRGGLTSRRPYSVPGPNSLWHIGKFNNF